MPHLLQRPAIIATVALMLSACMPTYNDPLPQANRRPMLLTYGLYVTPDAAKNPIDPPERFTGYHAAVDFEILPGEEDVQIPVTAICDGIVHTSAFAEGYGGLVVHSCVFEGGPVNVIYGHLLVDSLIEQGATVKTGDKLGVLAPGRSKDSDGNRKHLHLGIHKGSSPVLLGYVQSEEELKQFIDPFTVLPFGANGRSR